MPTHITHLPYASATAFYRRLCTGGASCLFESDSVADQSSRMSLIGMDPPLELVGKDSVLNVRLLNSRGRVYFDFLKTTFAGFLTAESATELELHIPKIPFSGPEAERIGRQNIAQPLRQLLAHFQVEEKNYAGLYGALSYRFVYLFEDIEPVNPCREPDFHLFLFDKVLVFNHLTRDLVFYQQITAEPLLAAEALEQLLETPLEPVEAFEIGAIQSAPDDDTFKKQVEQGVRLCNEGELLEIVLSRQLSASVRGDLMQLYERYRAINPSPYLFYLSLGDEVLLGASPELMLRYENGRATLRPISGSVRRSDNPIEDHRLMMELLNSPKENSELDMLIDLGRNDLARICKPGIKIDQYRTIEKYSHVTHTVAQLSGELDAGYSGFDALIASLNAGTLTGAPKVAAMAYIEQIEQHSRGYYGGCVGWMLFNGDVNTAITIRTAHVRDGQLSYCTGATLLYESEPERELQETKIKAGAFLAAVG